MASTKKEIFYWTSLVFYGAILTGVLLYVRFPAEKFRSYCERLIESRVPETSCNISKIQYIFPLQIDFEKVQVSSKKEGQKLLFEDPLLSIQPLWKNPINLFTLNSTAFGGNHVAQIEVNRKENILDLSDIVMKGVKLEKIYSFDNELERKVSGTADLKGAAKVKMDIFRILEAKGVVTVRDGEFGLKKPILELTTLKNTESTINVELKKDTISFTDGKLKNAQINTSFEGSIELIEPWMASIINIKGSMVPLAPLMKEKKSLRVIVSRMQKRYKTQALPYNVNGNISRPTFVFGN